VNRPAVSVLMLVYEHAEFVAQAIEGVLTQRCDFEFEIIVINDGSTDESAAVCQQYAAQHPEIITFIDSPKNQGMHAGFQQIWDTSRAPLVAFCEGDDYWSDPLKLQKQAALMTQNPHWALCGANAQVVCLDEDNCWSVCDILGPHRKQSEYTFEQLIDGYHFHFSTVMLKKSVVNFPSWFQTVYCVDRPLYLLAAEHGNAGYLDEVVSSYRLHPGGNWSSISNELKAERSVDLFHKMAGHFAPQYRHLFEITLFYALQSYVADALAKQNFTAARGIFWHAFASVRGWKMKLKLLKQYYKTAILLLMKR
jgi:glycosyltransferase involved in cell wall biosynthesis